MGNRYTKPRDVFFPRGAKTTSIAFPPDELGRFKAAAEAEGKSFNQWLFAAASLYMAGSRERAKAAQAAAKAER